MSSEPTSSRSDREGEGPWPEDSATASHRTAGLSIPCGACGAMLAYRPGTTSLHCEHCGNETSIEGIEPVPEERDYLATLDRLAAVQQTVEVTSIDCPSCGATVQLQGSVVAEDCPFCGTHLNVVQSTRRLIRPDSILPFGIERAEAESAFRTWLGSLWFAPNALKREAWKEKRLKGIYLPYWTFDTATVSDYTGQRGDHYYVTVGSGKNRRRVRRTRWRPASGRVGRRFDDVLVAASTTLPPELIHELTPWDLDAAVAYDDRFVAGFIAEAYQVDVREGHATARLHMTEVIRALVRQDIGGDVQSISSLDTTWSGITFKHLLLPIWVSAYRYRARTFVFLVNARTAEVQGERPWSWIKIALAATAGAAAAAGVIGAIIALR